MYICGDWFCKLSKFKMATYIGIFYKKNISNAQYSLTTTGGVNSPSGTMLQKSWVHMHARIEDLGSDWVLASSHVGDGVIGKSSFPSCMGLMFMSWDDRRYFEFSIDLNGCLEAFSI